MASTIDIPETADISALSSLEWQDVDATSTLYDVYQAFGIDKLSVDLDIELICGGNANAIGGGSSTDPDPSPDPDVPGEDIQKFTVTFIGFGGITLKTQEVNRGSQAQAPEAPHVDNYTFTGWNPPDFTDIRSDLAVTAQYELVQSPDIPAGSEFTLAFDARGGTAQFYQKTVIYGQPYGALPSASYDGKDFLGWWKHEDRTLTEVVSSGIFDVQEDQTLYAHWIQHAPTDEEVNVSIAYANSVLSSESSYNPLDEAEPMPDFEVDEDFIFNGLSNEEFGELPDVMPEYNISYEGIEIDDASI